MREAIECALLLSLKTDAPHLVLLAGDQPPHFKEEIPLHLPDRRTAVEVAAEFKQKSIPIYTFLVGGDSYAKLAFEAIAQVSGGVSGMLDGGDAMIQMAALAITTRAGGIEAATRLAGRLQLTAGARAFADRLQIGPGRR